MSALAAAAWLASVAGAGAVASPAPEDFAIVGATVEVGNGRILSRAAVIIKGGRIESVQEGGEAPAGLKIVHAEGKRLYPGFIDGFSTRGIKTPSSTTLPERPGTGTGAPASFWEGYRRGITPEFRAVESLEYLPTDSGYRQGVSTALVSPSRGGMRGMAAVIDCLDAEAKDRVLLSDAAEAFSFRIGAGSGYPTNLLGSIALTRQVLMDAQSYRDGVFEIPKKDPPAWQAALKGLQPVIAGTTPVLWEAQSAREMERAMSICSEFGLKLILLGGREAGALASRLKEQGIPVVLSVDPGREPGGGGSSEDTPPADRQPAEFVQERKDKWTEQAKGDQALAREGVLFCFGSDSSMSGLLTGVRARIARGLPREAALQALTAGAARILGLSDAGTVEPGRRASLVLMSGPFEDKDSTVEALWVSGRPVYRAEAGK